ncbi:MAG: xylan 1,4-beta-xylosidase [Ruminococcaceae bacterium]|nr:xylan 1,4-beta-xylosidase [Oscillospiraceae bacterium]
MAKDKRFVVTEKEGSAFTNLIQVIVDKKTGVNYMYIQSGNSGGLTPLLDREGKPLITSVTNLE